MTTSSSEHPDPFALARPDGNLACSSITGLMRLLDMTTSAYNCADRQALNAHSAGDIRQNELHEAEMQRLAALEQRLERKICRGCPTNADEALMQIVVAAGLLNEIANDLAKRKAAKRAETAVRSALRFLVPSLGAKLPDQLTRWALRDRDGAPRQSLAAQAAQ